MYVSLTFYTLCPNKAVPKSLLFLVTINHDHVIKLSYLQFPLQEKEVPSCSLLSIQPRWLVGGGSRSVFDSFKDLAAELPPLLRSSLWSLPFFRPHHLADNCRYSSGFMCVIESSSRLHNFRCSLFFYVFFFILKREGRIGVDSSVF